MVARGLWATPSCRCVVVSLSPRVPFLPLLVRKDEQDLGRKTRGGRCPRGIIEGVFLTSSRSCSPGPVLSRLFRACIMMHHDAKLQMVARLTYTIPIWTLWYDLCSKFRDAARGDIPGEIFHEIGLRSSDFDETWRVRIGSSSSIHMQSLG